MLQQFSLSVSVCERKQLTQSKDNSKLQLNDRLGAPVFWIALFSFYSYLREEDWGRKKKKAQLGQNASSLVSGELCSAQTKIAVIFCWQTLFNARVFFFVKLSSFLIYEFPGKKGWCIHIVALIYCSLKMYEENKGVRDVRVLKLNWEQWFLKKKEVH